MDKQQEPRLRFQGFKDDWKEKTLGEVSDVFDGTHQTPNYKDSGIMFLSVENIGTLTSNKFISENDFNKQFKIFPEKGDVLMTRIGDIGTTNVVTSEEFLAYYVSLALLKPKIINPYFLSTVISSSETQSDINKRTLHVAFPKKINKSEIEKVEIKIPTLPEQTHLGLFFRRLDSQIAESRAVLEKSRQLKKAMLAKMFPANGEKIPKIRFKGFEGAWEREILKDVVNVFDNLRIPVSENKRTSGNTPYFGANGIQDYVDGFTHNGEFVLIAEDGANDLKNYPVQYVNGKCWVNNHAHVLQGKSEILNNIFLFSRFQSMDISQFLVGGGRAKLNGSTMLEIEIEFPKDKKEQTAIGNFFRQLDETIALQSAEVEKLNQLKKGLLAAMLV